jgi:hypothetical protein
MSLSKLGLSSALTAQKPYLSPEGPTVEAAFVASLEDFDRYVAEHGIPEEGWPAAFARWIAERTGL